MFLVVHYFCLMTMIVSTEQVYWVVWSLACSMEAMSRDLETLLVLSVITACHTLLFICLGIPFLAGTVSHPGFHIQYVQPFARSLT